MGEMMSLIEAVHELDSFDQESTIYASEPWSKDSRVLVALESNSSGLADRVEELRLKYFLEVFIAQEFLQGWISNLERVPGTEEKTERLIQYASTDA